MKRSYKEEFNEVPMQETETGEKEFSSYGNIDNNNNQEPKRDKFSYKALFSIFSAIILIVAIVLIIFSSVIGSRKNQQEEVKNIESQEKVVEETKKDTESKDESSKEDTDEETITDDTSTNDEKSTSKNTKSGIKASEDISKQAEVLTYAGNYDLGNEMSTSVVVSAKEEYRSTNGSSLVYVIKLLMPDESAEDGYTPVSYYCSKKTYEGVSIGDTVIVNFQLDDEGYVAINSISK